jgi:uncharacterized protein
MCVNPLEPFWKIIHDIIEQPAVINMKMYIAHGDVNCLEHSLYVAYTSYRFAVKLGIDPTLITRGAMLHDLYLYDWHIKGDRTGLHGFTHSKVALENAKAFFALTEIEEQIILRHMWPLTWPAPTKKEAFIVSLCDKYCTTLETFKLQDRKTISDLMHPFNQK